LRHFVELVALNNFNALSVFSLTHLGDLSPVKLAGQKSPMISTTSALAKEKCSFLWRFIFQCLTNDLWDQDYRYVLWRFKQRTSVFDYALLH
jgi:hypothetical protein